ncbi:MAG: GNAT family N-acetyltransferase [Clostridia bacterium]|nr:GNAT family N-acetyltransferase [Clostridia bacterium]
MLTELYRYNDEKATTERNARTVENGEKAVFVVFAGGRPEGELHALFDGDEILAKRGCRAYFCDFRVRSESRGKGFGKLLLSGALDMLEKDGYREFTVGIEAGNARAAHLFGSLGFDVPLPEKSDKKHIFLLKKV